MQALRPGAVAGVAAIASVVALDPAGWYPFGPAKWWLVSSLTAAAFALHLWRRRGVSIGRGLGALGALLLVWLTIATVLGREERYAWLGTPERHLGMLAFVLFAAAAVRISTESAEVSRVVYGGDIEPPADPHWFVATSTDALHVAVEPLAELLGVDDTDIRTVNRISTDGTTTVLAVSLHEQRPDGTYRQLVLVGTPAT